MRTGCVLGHLSPASALLPGAYATWLLWSGLSRLTPSQHEGKMIVARIPPGHGVEGKLAVSPEEQGAPLPPIVASLAFKQRWQIPGYVPLWLRSVGSPASIRKPCRRSDDFSGISVALLERTYWLWHCCLLRTAAKRPHIVNRQATILFE